MEPYQAGIEALYFRVRPVEFPYKTGIDPNRQTNCAMLRPPPLVEGGPWNTIKLVGFYSV